MHSWSAAPSQGVLQDLFADLQGLSLLQYANLHTLLSFLQGLLQLPLTSVDLGLQLL